MRNALDGAKAAGSGLAPTPEEIARAEEFRQREEAIAATIRDAIALAVHDFNKLSDIGKRTWIEWEERVAGWMKWLGEGYLRLREVAAEVRKMAQDWGLIGQDEPAAGQPQADGPLVVRVTPQRRVDRSAPLPGGAAKSRAARDPIDPDSVANLIRQLEKTRDVAEAEYTTFALTNVERLKAVELAKAEAVARADVENGVRTSATLTVDETNRITEAAKATADFKDQLQDLKDERDLLRSSGAEFMKGFAADLQNGVGLVDALSNAISRLAQRLGDSHAFGGQIARLRLGVRPEPHIAERRRHPLDGCRGRDRPGRLHIGLGRWGVGGAAAERAQKIGGGSYLPGAVTVRAMRFRHPTPVVVARPESLFEGGIKRHVLRHVLTCSRGFVLAALVTAANVHDTQAAGWLFDRAAQAGWAPERVKVDGIYTGARMDEAAARHGLDVQVSTRAPETKGFEPWPLRWRIVLRQAQDEGNLRHPLHARPSPDAALGAEPGGSRRRHQHRQLPPPIARLSPRSTLPSVVKQALRACSTGFSNQIPSS